jgi:DDE superfamily endonuclease
MAEASGLSTFAVWKIWKANGLKPHLVRTFKVSNDPQFAEKVEDIVGLYLAPPEHAVVFSVDEKTQIQALDRRQPGLPLKKGRCGTMTHDYKRNGTTTLFAALNTLDGTVIADTMPKHRRQEWLKFLKQIYRLVPKDKEIHIICDNYATHKCRLGWPRTGAFTFTSRRRADPGSIWWNGYSETFLRTAYAEGSSAAWTNWRRPSTSTSPGITPTPSPSSGRQLMRIFSAKWRGPKPSC